MKTPMLRIAKLKVDDTGRITLPKTFLDANNIKKGTTVSLTPIYNSNGLRLEFGDK
tara:strand:- start:1055 stop:1222 length:168 start_codon:yes stop_codon:yes gene_type:complete